MRPETQAFRRAFLAAAAAAAGAPLPAALGEGEQRTAAWLQLREARLTASAFGNALGRACHPFRVLVWALLSCAPRRSCVPIHAPPGWRQWQ